MQKRFTAVSVSSEDNELEVCRRPCELRRHYDFQPATTRPAANLRHEMKDLKEKTIRGGLARISAQAASFLLRIGSLMILARQLSPVDFGLVGMATAFTGILSLFRDFGLGAAAVQRSDVTDEQISNLFWVNVVFGVVLALMTAALAPAVVAFYHEPRLLWVTVILAFGFFCNALGVQHSAF